MSPIQSPTSSPHLAQSPPNADPSKLPSLDTGLHNRRTASPRPRSYAKNRLSTYSTTSRLSETRSRPVSHAFPAFHSSLPYALVRDFAYPIAHPWHYGPPADLPGGASGNSTPASESQRRLSGSVSMNWEGGHPHWGPGSWEGESFFSDQQLPQMAYGDGPPYSEDEDLQSPVVVSSRQKKSKSTTSKSNSKHARMRTHSDNHNSENHERTGSHREPSGQRSYFTGINREGMETYYIGEENESAGGPGGELVTYPPDQGPNPMLAPDTYAKSDHRGSHLAAILPNRTYMQGEQPEDSEGEEYGDADLDQDSRYSKDYQFTIASPDEEMHGKAVALFDFERENENELPLSEGQVIWVSYRHGQGWLVAEDPKTGDAGLVPEEYVRLVRHIEGGLTYLSGEQDEGDQPIPPTVATDDAAVTQTDQEMTQTPQNNGSSNGGGGRPPVVSTFSTSSKDLKRYPHHLLEEQTRGAGAPPQVLHYGSQSSTPTVTSPFKNTHGLPTHDESEDDEERTVKDEREEQKIKAHR